MLSFYWIPKFKSSVIITHLFSKCIHIGYIKLMSFVTEKVKFGGPSHENAHSKFSSTKFQITRSAVVAMNVLLNLLFINFRISLA